MSGESPDRSAATMNHAAGLAMELPRRRISGAIEAITARQLEVK